MYAPGNAFPFPGQPNGVPGNAAAGGQPAGAAAGAAGANNNYNNNAAGQNGNINNNNGGNGYGMGPTWGAAQQAAYMAQFGGAYVPGFGAGAPAGGGGIGGMGGGGFGVGNNNYYYPAGGVGGGGGVGPIPPNFGATYGVGLGFQAMGPGAMGGGFANGGVGGAPNMMGGQMPHGMPPNNGRGATRPPGMPPMWGVHPGQHMGVPPQASNTIPSPDASTKKLGWQCWKMGTKDPEGISNELRVEIERIRTYNTTFDRDAYINQVCNQTELVVYLTMNPCAPQVLPVYGLGKYSPVRGDRSMLVNRYFAFLGTGDHHINEALHVLPNDTIDAFGTLGAGHAAELATLDGIFVGNDSPTFLAPPATNATVGASLVVYWKLMPVPLGLVHLFDDLCHPYVALCKLRYLEDRLPTQQQKESLSVIKMWLRMACHSATLNGPSNLVLQWDGTKSYGGDANAGVTAWAETRHEMFIPSPNVLPPQDAPSHQALSATEVLQLLKEERKAAAKEPVNKGCRKVTPEELALLVAFSGLADDTSKEDLDDLGFTFISDWEKTQGNEAKMRQMMASRNAESAQELGIPNPVKYLRKAYVDTIKYLNWSVGLGNDWARSHLGLSLAAVSYMIGTAEQASADTSRDQVMGAASFTTAADEEARLGKPGESPEGLTNLIKHIGAYLIQLHSVGGLKGKHQLWVKQIRAILIQYENVDAPVPQEQLDSVFWAITLDGRFIFASPENARNSMLGSLVGQMVTRAIVQRFDVPWQLSPSRARKRSALEGSGNSDEVEVGDPAPKKKKSLVAGNIVNYHPSIENKWEQVCAKSGTVPLVKDVLAAVKDKDGQPYTFTSFSEVVLGGGLCTVAHITGSCSFPGCKYNHKDTVKSKNAKKVCRVLDDFLDGKKGPVKKEKP